MTEGVWVSNWEVQCCGDPFSTGETVDWPVTEASSESWLNERFAGLDQVKPTYEYSAHGSYGDQDRHSMTAVIRSIEALHYELHLDPDPSGHGVALLPTPGTERLTLVDSDLMWELEPDDPTRVSFAGWHVQVDVLSLEPMRVDELVQESRPKTLSLALRSYRRRRDAKSSR